MGVATCRPNDDPAIWLGKEKIGRANSDKYWRQIKVTFQELASLSFFSFIRLGDKTKDIVSGLFFDFDDSELRDIIGIPFLSDLNYILYPSCSADLECPKNWHLIVPLKNAVSQNEARILLAVLLRDVFPTADPSRSDPLPSIFGSDKQGVGFVANSDGKYFDPSELLAKWSSPQALTSLQAESPADRRIAKATMPDIAGSTARDPHSLIALQNALIHRELHGVKPGEIPDPNKVFNLFPHDFQERNSTRLGWIQWDGDHPWHESKSRKSFSVFFNSELGLFEWFDRVSNVGGLWTAYAVNIKKGHNAHRSIETKDFWLSLESVVPNNVYLALTATKNVDKLKAILYPNQYTYEPKKVVTKKKVKPQKSQDNSSQDTSDLKHLVNALSIDSELKTEPKKSRSRNSEIGGTPAAQNELENRVINEVFTAWKADQIPQISQDGRAFIYFDRGECVWVYRSGLTYLQGHIGSWMLDRAAKFEGLDKCRTSTIVEAIVKFNVCRLKTFDGIYKTPGIIPFSNCLASWTKDGLKTYPYDKNFPAEKFQFFSKLPYPFTLSPDLGAIDRFKSLIRSMLILDSESRPGEIQKADLAAEILMEWLSLVLRGDGAAAKHIPYLFGSGDAGKSTLANIIGQFLGDAFLPASAATLQSNFLGSSIAPQTSLLFLDEFDPGNLSKSEGNLKQLSTFAGSNTTQAAGLRLQEKYGGFRTQKQPYFFILASELCASIALSPQHAGLARRLIMFPVIANPSVIPQLANFQVRDEMSAELEELVISNLSSIASFLIADRRTKSKIRDSLSQLRSRYDRIVLFKLRIQHEACSSFVYNILKLDGIGSNTDAVSAADLYPAFETFLAKYFSLERKYWGYSRFIESIKRIYPEIFRAITNSDLSNQFLVREVKDSTIDVSLFGIVALKRL